MDLIRDRIVRLYLSGLRREEGQTMTEYGVLLAVIALVVIVAAVTLGGKVTGVFNTVSNGL